MGSSVAYGSSVVPTIRAPDFAIDGSVGVGGPVGGEQTEDLPFIRNVSYPTSGSNSWNEESTVSEHSVPDTSYRSLGIVQRGPGITQRLGGERRPPGAGSDVQDVVAEQTEGGRSTMAKKSAPPKYWSTRGKAETTRRRAPRRGPHRRPQTVEQPFPEGIIRIFPCRMIVALRLGCGRILGTRGKTPT